MEELIEKLEMVSTGSGADILAVNRGEADLAARELANGKIVRLGHLGVSANIFSLTRCILFPKFLTERSVNKVMSPRTPEQNKEIREQTRQQIVEAAFELFARAGYSKTSIAAVAKKAGISKGLIYHYFESKEDILKSILNQMVEVGDQILDFPKDFTPADKIRQVLEGTFRFIEEQTEKGRLTVALALQPETSDSLKPIIDEVNKTQMVLYFEMLDELGYEQPELEAYHLGALMDGILLGYATMGDDYPLEKMKQKIMDEYVPS